MVPSESYVGWDEELEHIGEIMNISDRSVIVRGVASASAANVKTLDAGSLLVFDDRRVLGYVGNSVSANVELGLILPTARSMRLLVRRTSHSTWSNFDRLIRVSEELLLLIPPRRKIQKCRNL
jgi:hypothetical protein